MRVTTLKAPAAGVGGVLDYYVGLAEDRARPDGLARGPVDYSRPNEPAGRRWGHGRTALGLNGEVPGDDLRAVP